MRNKRAAQNGPTQRPPAAATLPPLASLPSSPPDSRRRRQTARLTAGSSNTGTDRAPPGRGPRSGGQTPLRARSAPAAAGPPPPGLPARVSCCGTRKYLLPNWSVPTSSLPGPRSRRRSARRARQAALIPPTRSPPTGPARPRPAPRAPAPRRVPDPAHGPPACQQRRSPLVAVGQSRANPGLRWRSGGRWLSGADMLGFISARQAGIDDPVRLRRAECTRR